MTPYVEGGDGRIYFVYSPGDRYELYLAETAIATVEIVDCDVVNGRELYAVGTVNGKAPEIYERSRLDWLFNFSAAKKIREGTAKEYPLTVEEVTWYFTGQKIARESERRKADRKLREISEYVKLEAEQDKLEHILSERAANGEDFGELKQRYGAVCAERRRMIETCGFDFSLFLPVETCRECGGNGVVGTKICTCAYDRAEEIKRINVAKRLEKRLRTQWAYVAKDPEEQRLLRDLPKCDKQKRSQ
ncbi:MAG: hypothetical protein J6C93_07785 [Clostridia bacterium]|nr:hypothetical protein [Clostridia bacterium]